MAEGAQLGDILSLPVQPHQQCTFFAVIPCARTKRGQHSQAGVHVLESVLCLFEEAKNNALGKIALLLVIVHLKDLFEGQGIDVIPEIR